ncbi:response regulator [Dyella sp. S184]|uniref:response regulator n=1 Tax=Dyella sp. S184 TaxID=1641862 RepID=UPI00131E1AD1|nr:response regulator [Dyella sp. S184]
MDGLALRNGIGFFKRLLGGKSDEQRVNLRLQMASGSRVLVVDDSPTICAVLGKMLGQDGYSVTKAPDGESAIELARNELPALIFLDIVLPGINGFSVLRSLRQDPQTRPIPIVMISGNPQATEQFYVQRFGADDFIKKPFGRNEVAICIDQLIRSGRLAARDIAFEQMLALAMMHDVKPGSLQSLAI